MAASDSTITTGSANVSLDSSAVTTSSGTVQRERVTVGDPNVGANLLAVFPDGAIAVNQATRASRPRHKLSLRECRRLMRSTGAPDLFLLKFPPF